MKMIKKFKLIIIFQWRILIARMHLKTKKFINTSIYLNNQSK